MFTDKRMVDGVEVEVVAAKLGHVRIVGVEPSSVTNRPKWVTPLTVPANVSPTDPAVVALQPVLDVARRIDGAGRGSARQSAHVAPPGCNAGRRAGLTRNGGSKIQIAPDRRGEMRVRVVAQPEMPDILRAVDRLLQ